MLFFLYFGALGRNYTTQFNEKALGICLTFLNVGVEPMSTTLDRVKKIVIEQLSCEEEKVVPEASFIDDLGADSLDTVELVMAFEEEFDIEIPDEVAETIQTVADAVAKIDEHAS